MPRALRGAAYLLLLLRQLCGEALVGAQPLPLAIFAANQLSPPPPLSRSAALSPPPPLTGAATEWHVDQNGRSRHPKAKTIAPGGDPRAFGPANCSAGIPGCVVVAQPARHVADLEVPPVPFLPPVSHPSHLNHKKLAEADNGFASCFAACVREFGDDCAGFDTRVGCMVYRYNGDIANAVVSASGWAGATCYKANEPGVATSSSTVVGLGACLNKLGAPAAVVGGVRLPVAQPRRVGQPLGAPSSAIRSLTGPHTGPCPRRALARSALLIPCTLSSVGGPT